MFPPPVRLRRAPRVIALALALALVGACGKENGQGDAGGRRNLETGPAAEPVTVELARDAAAGPGARLAEKADAARDDWNTEVLGDAAAARLKEIAKLIEHPERWDDAEWSELSDADARFGSLRPQALEEAFDDGTFAVRRWKGAGQGADPTSLRAAVEELAAPLRDGLEPHAKFKLYRIDVEGDRFTTRVLYQASNHWNDRGLQQSGTWLCTWRLPPSEKEPPVLLAAELEKYEEVAITAPGGRLFSDCTVTAMGDSDAYRDLILPGTNHWLPRLSRALYGITGHHGLAIGDVDGDGLEDLYVCESGGLPNMLFLHNPDGSVDDYSRESGLDWLDSTAAALFIDLDGDGDQDLAATTIPDFVVAENDGTGRFEVRAKRPISRGAKSLCAADYDEDGDLDLYICNYAAASESDGVGAYPYHDANNGESNLLLRNEGEFTFTDATAKAGLDENNTRFSFAAAWDDFDNDGDLDLYVANDFGRNNLYRNDGGRFRDVAAQAGVEDIASGMSVAWGDYDRNGWTDVYVANMFSSAGGRVAYQRRFAEGRSAETLANVQRMARGNTLFANTGAGTFDDVSEFADVTLGRWAWSSKFADLNNDGWQDLVIANGYLTMENPDDL